MADADIALVNERLDEAQGMQFLERHLVRGALCQYLTMCLLDADDAAAVESLRAELARAKEQASESDAATRKALEELRAEQAAHCRSKKEMAEMDEKLKSAADRCRLLEKEDQAK